MIKSNTTLYASDDSQEAIKEAREYIKAQGFTKEDVRLVSRDKMILVISRKDWE